MAAAHPVPEFDLVLAAACCRRRGSERTSASGRDASTRSAISPPRRRGGEWTSRGVSSCRGSSTYLLVVAAHMGAAEDMAAVLEMVTVEPARILGHRDHGVAVGCRADLVVLDASSLAEAMGGVPARVPVLKGGRITFEAGGNERAP